jgi:L-lactate dehydrogenase (cytochrome)
MYTSKVLIPRLGQRAGARFLRRFSGARLRVSSKNGVPLGDTAQPTGLKYSKFTIAGFLVVGGLIAVADRSISLDVDPRKTGITVDEVEKHNSMESGVWVVINNDVYDLTNFLSMHPGGAKIILEYAGKNASKIFNRYHSKDVFENLLPEDAYLGPLIGEMEEAEDVTEDNDPARLERIENKPSINKVFNISDFEYIAKQILTDNAWAYYSSAADDEITLRENHYAYQRIFMNPKVLVKTDDVDMSTTMLGTPTEVPFYCSAAAQARLGHEDGELSIARGCGKEGVIQMISTYASCALDDIIDAGVGPQWFQLYVNPDRAVSYKTIKKVTERGIKGLFVTVDTASVGNREKGKRHALTGNEDDDAVDSEDASTEAAFEKSFLTAYEDPQLTWEDIKQFKKATNMPVVVKGVQRVEDVLLAVEHGIDGVVLSNHGGRQLDFSRSPIEVLADVMPVLREKKLDDKIEVYIDGGVRRGTDVLKALCLGAKGVGLGRPFLYANSCYGEEGVRKAIAILKEEIAVDMKLLGVSKISELDPSLLDLRGLYSRPNYSDFLYNQGYVPLGNPKFKNE